MSISIQAKTRTSVRKHLGVLRAEKAVPAIVYGFNTESKPVQVVATELDRVFREAGSNQIVELSLDASKSIDVLIKEVQIDPIRQSIIHADFLAVDVNKPITVPVPIHYVGESAAVKFAGGALVKKMDHIELKALPKSMPKFVTIDLSKLETLEDHILIRDIHLDPALEIMNEADDVIVTIAAPRTETFAATTTVATDATAAATPAAAPAKEAEAKK